MSTLISVNQAAAHLGVTPTEVIDAAGLTLGELEYAAGQAGLDASQYRQVPVIDANHLEVIATRLDSNGRNTSHGNAKTGAATPAPLDI